MLGRYLPSRYINFQVNWDAPVKVEHTDTYGTLRKVQFHVAHPCLSVRFLSLVYLLSSVFLDEKILNFLTTLIRMAFGLPQ
jgi:hypothetical protein